MEDRLMITLLAAIAIILLSVALFLWTSLREQDRRHAAAIHAHMVFGDQLSVRTVRSAQHWTLGGRPLSEPELRGVTYLLNHHVIEEDREATKGNPFRTDTCYKLKT